MRISPHRRHNDHASLLLLSPRLFSLLRGCAQNDVQSVRGLHEGELSCSQGKSRCVWEGPHLPCSYFFSGLYACGKPPLSATTTHSGPTCYSRATALLGDSARLSCLFPRRLAGASKSCLITTTPFKSFTTLPSNRHHYQALKGQASRH